jgi:hypothetical protein
VKLRLFKINYPFKNGYPSWIFIEATDFGDAQSRAILFDSRMPTEITDGTDLYRVVTHFDYIEAQSREEVRADLDAREEEERAF